MKKYFDDDIHNNVSKIRNVAAAPKKQTLLRNTKRGDWD